jgi:hypothetical protein
MPTGSAERPASTLDVVALPHLAANIARVTKTTPEPSKVSVPEIITQRTLSEADKKTLHEAVRIAQDGERHSAISLAKKKALEFGKCKHNEELSIANIPSRRERVPSQRIRT